MGDRGCDNHLAYLFNEVGLQVLNPSKDIRAIHLHTIDVMASSHRGKKVGDGKYLKVAISNLKMT